MPPIYDQDQSAESDNPAERLERERIQRATSQPGTDELDPDYVDGGIDDAEEHANQDAGGSGSGKSGAGFYRSGDNSPRKGKGDGAAGENQTKPGFGERFGSTIGKYADKSGNLLKNKWFVGAGVGAIGLSVIAMILLLAFSAYKIPHLTANISSWRFARVMAKAASQNERTMSTKIAVDAATESQYGKLRTAYNKSTGKVSETWSKLDKYRPNKQIANLNASGMQFNYSGRRLVGITINDRTLLTPKSNFIKDRIPFYKFTQGVKISAQFTPELNTALRLTADDPGIIVRGIVNSKLRKQLGISYIAWKAGQYKGKTQEQVRIAEEKANAQAVATKDSTRPVTKELDKDTQKVQDAQDETLNDDNKVKQAITNNGVSDDVAEAVDEVGKGSAFKTTLGVLSAPYAVAVPLCIIYDGSIDHSGSVVDANSARQIKAWSRAATIGDQEKDGKTVDPKIIEAANAKAGEVNNTVVTKRMQGQAYTTAGAPSPQAGANGTYSMFNALLQDAHVSLPAGAIELANKGAEGACQTLTNEWVALGYGIANLIPAILSGGTEEVAMQSVGQAARYTITRTAEKAAVRFSIKSALRNTAYNITGGAKLKVFLYKELAKSAAVAGTTLLAKYYVLSKSGELNNGLEQGADYVSQIDSGADLNANEISRQYQFGRPLTKEEVAAANAETATIVAKENSSKSAYQRYFAMSNPNSLISGVSSRLASSVGSNSIPNFFRSIGLVLNPSNLTQQLSAVVSPTARAAAAGGEANYSNIQWGWTQAELSRIAKDSSYEVLENQSILDASGREDEIAGKFAKCFGVDSDGTTIGTLLAKGDIQRDEDGNVKPVGGDCSPTNLSFNNPEYNGDLVFRWRVAQGDKADLDEKLYEQDVTVDTAVDTSSTGDTQFNVATFNIRHSDGEAKEKWEGRLHRTIDALNEGHVDIAGLQEVRPNQNVAFRQDDFGGSKYDLYPAANSTGGDFTPNPIIWNKERFKLVEKVDGLPVSYFEDEVGQTSQKVTMVMLQETSTGQKFYVANTHDPADTQKHGDNANLRLANAHRYAEYFNKLAASGIPIIFTGDFNNRYDTISSNGNNPVGNLCTNLTYRIISEAGALWDAYDASQNHKAPKCPEKAATPGNRNSVDHIFVSNSVNVNPFKNMANVGAGNNGSDHSTVVATVIIPGPEGAAEATAAGDTSGQSSKITTVPNFRDAGTATGVIKQGLLYRSGTLSTISDKDAASLSKLLLGSNGRILDLQSTNDKKYAKDKQIPNVAQPAPLGIPATLDYTEFVDNKVDRQGFNQALTTIANAGGPVLVHCHAGNDRTGWTVAMIMYALGGSDSDVFKEYTTSPNIPQNGSWLRAGLNDVQKKFDKSGSKGYHDAVMKYLTTSIDRGGLGLSHQTITSLQHGLGSGTSV